MHNNSKIIATFTLAFALAVLVGCSDNGPTASSGFDANRSGGAFGPRSLAVEQFSCDDVEEHVRFSDPGSIDNETATLFYSYGGVTDGTHALNVIWDEDSAPQVREEVPLDDVTTPAAEEGSVDIAGTVAHTYTGITGDTPRTVRVELTIDGLTGNCSTVRHITVTATPPAPDPCRGAFVGLPAPVLKGCRVLDR